MPDTSTVPVPVRGVSQRAATMPRSAIREIMALAAGRPDVIHLEVGEPDVSTPSHIVEGAFAAARDGWTKYSSNAGLPFLRGLVAERSGKAWGVKVAAEQVVVTTGAIGALHAALMSVLDTGDEVLIPDPGWPNYEAIVHLAGAEPVRFAQPPERHFLPNPAEIRNLIGPRTKAIVINTPGNPSGAVFPAPLMKEIVEIARETGIYLISDEIYEDLIFDGEHVSAGRFGLDDRVFVTSGVSKSYAMTGWRLGWVVCPPALAATVAGLQEPVASCASTIAQKAAEVALSADQGVVTDFRDMFLRRRGILLDVFKGTSLLPAVPAGAFYALVDISATGNGSLDFAKRFLAARDTAVVPGITFGPLCDRYVRVAFTIGDAQLREGLNRLRSFIDRN